MKTVGKITFEFRSDDHPFVLSLYGRWDNFFDLNVVRVADEVLSRYDRPEEHLSLESLTLDLGDIVQEDFYKDFPLIFREKLDDAMSRLEYSVSAGEVQATKLTLMEDAYTLLTLFLLHGRIDSARLASYGSLNDLFLSVIRHNGERFTSFLRTYGHYTGLRDRIVQQFDDGSLEAGVRLLSPEAGDFICSYVRLLQSRYERLERPTVTRTGYRYAVWGVVYSYLLNNRGSYFNRKSFLVQTLVSLAARLNITFKYLTGLFVEEVPESPDIRSTLPEILVMLREINRENLKDEIRRATLDPKSFYRIAG